MYLFKKTIALLLVATIFIQISVSTFADEIDNSILPHVESSDEIVFCQENELGQQIVVVIKTVGDVHMSKLYIDGLLVNKTILNINDMKMYSEGIDENTDATIMDETVGCEGYEVAYTQVTLQEKKEASDEVWQSILQF